VTSWKTTIEGASAKPGRSSSARVASTSSMASGSPWSRAMFQVTTRTCADAERASVHAAVAPTNTRQRTARRSTIGFVSS